MAASAAASAAILASGTISINGTETILGPNRVFRNTVASVAGTAKPFPGTVPCGGNCGFRTVSVPTGGGTVTVTVTDVTSGVNLFYVGYLNTFNPAALNANYLGDPGNSVLGNTVTFSVDVPAGGTFVLVFQNDTAGGTGTVSFTITGTPPTTSVPAISGFGLFATAALLALAGVFTFRRDPLWFGR
jgi:hypothetical protein